MMAVSKMQLIEMRLDSLEREIKEVKQQLQQSAGKELPWWEKIAGTFANDPDYDKAMELGKKYRESLRPQSAKKKSVKKTAKRTLKTGGR